MIQTEPLTAETANEIALLVGDYYSRTPAHRGIPPYDFRWSVYFQCQDAGCLSLTTARRDGSLIGIALYIIMEAPHHAGMIVAECDSLSVSPEKRGGGVGEKLYWAAEADLKARGVVRVFNRHRLCYGSSPLFPRLGFVAEETVYMKDL